MKEKRWFLLAAVLFVAVSVLLYYIHFLVFHDTHHIFIYMLGDFAFLPLEVFIVVIVIERVLARREKQGVMYKLNMVIGAFFSEIGNHLLKEILPWIHNRDDISAHLNVRANWTAREFQDADAYANYLKMELNKENVDLDSLKNYLHGKRLYLLTLLENPSLLEHDRFTDLLWATTHLAEELEMRDTLKELPPADMDHIMVDIKRMYDHLTSEWLDYVQHLKASYPFLFSLVLRTHPFQEAPSPVVEQS